MDLEQYLSSRPYKLLKGIHVFDQQSARDSRLNRINVLEDIGKGRVWKNVYAHYFRFLFVLRWLKSGTILVDTGCGRGWLMDLIYRNQHKVSYIGVDLSLASLQYAAEKQFAYPKLLMRANSVDLPLQDNFADYVVCMEIIEHNSKEDAERIIRSCYRILKPGGRFFVSTPNRKGDELVFPEDHIYEWEFSELSTFLQSIGLEIQQVAGCFGKKETMLSALDDAEKQMYMRLKDYFSWHVLSAFFSALHPEEAQGAIWLCRK